MGLRHCFEAVERSICHVHGDEGASRIVWVASGDLRQVFSAVRRGSVEQIVSSSLRKSPLWPSFRQLLMTVNMCVQRLSSVGQAAQSSLFDSFVRWVLSIGDGTVHPVAQRRAEEEASQGAFVKPSGVDAALEVQLRRRLPTLGARAAPRRKCAGQSAVQLCTTAIRIPRLMGMPKGAACWA